MYGVKGIDHIADPHAASFDHNARIVDFKLFVLDQVMPDVALVCCDHFADIIRGNIAFHGRTFRKGICARWDFSHDL